MRRTAWALLAAVVAVFLMALLLKLGDTARDPAIQPYLELASFLKRSFGCASVTIRETGPDGATRLRVTYVVGEHPAVEGPQKEKENIAEVALSLWKKTPIVGVDVERKARRPGGGCEERYDVTTLAKEAPPKRH